MRVVHLKKALPRVWSKHPAAEGVLLEKDLRVTTAARLRCKLLVFSSIKALHHFWEHVMRHEYPGRACLGITSSLRTDHRTIAARGDPIKDKVWTTVDPRYFAVIGLSVTQLWSDYLAHECVHAGYAYAKRTQHRAGWSEEAIDDNPEEFVAYPTGRIFRDLHCALHNAGIYEQWYKYRDAHTRAWKRKHRKKK